LYGSVLIQGTKGLPNVECLNTSLATGRLAASGNGAIRVRLPRSVHAVLLAEAKAEGVSLNQLCLSTLVVQLRAVI
jgi:predicted HicB family RNase H-like nuclease